MHVEMWNKGERDGKDTKKKKKKKGKKKRAKRNLLLVCQICIGYLAPMPYIPTP